ncbi:MAG TPA: class I SAM-dependent methyltransferase [Saprospiraceae bacterium]|nr:class I SAM-dependent methyltransferase [Saprospiraceae bacterium]
MNRLPNPSFNYNEKGQQYSGQRKTDPRIAAQIHHLLGNAKTVLNVGAGSGSYEPDDRYVVAVEPSRVMRAQRIALGRAPAVQGTADVLPFDDGAFDASMAIATVHHWPDVARGLAEMRRVTKGPVIVMSFDPDAYNVYWTAEYFPELLAVEGRRTPAINLICESLGGQTQVIPVIVPVDCVDGFQEAYFGRPEAFLEQKVRQSQSAWSFLPEGLEEVLVDRLRKALESGEWDKKYGHYRSMPEMTGSIRLIVSNPDNHGQDTGSHRSI